MAEYIAYAPDGRVPSHSEEFPIFTEQALNGVVVISVATAVTDIPAVHVFAIMIPKK